MSGEVGDARKRLAADHDTAPGQALGEGLTQDERRWLGCDCWQIGCVWQHRRDCKVPAVERILAARATTPGTEASDALRAAAKEVDLSEWFDPGVVGNVSSDCIKAEAAAEYWLRDRADSLDPRLIRGRE